MITKEVILWFRKFNDRLIGLCVTFGVTVVGYMLVLSFCRMLWRLYSETKVGDMFAAGNDPLFSAIDAFIRQNPFMLSLEISFLAVKICFMVALVSHFSFLKRLFYDSREVSGKIFYTGVPCVVLTAVFFNEGTPALSFAVCLIPSLALFSFCFGMVGKFLPETDDLVKNVIKKMKD